jgi:hypothetical protein
MPRLTDNAPSDKNIMKKKTACISAAAVSVSVAVVSFVLLYLKFKTLNPSCVDFTYFHFFKTSLLPPLLQMGTVDPFLLMTLGMTPMTVLLGLVFSIFNSYLIIIAYESFFTGAIIFAYFHLAAEETDRPAWSLLLTVALALNPLVDFYATVGYKPDLIGCLALVLALFARKKSAPGWFRAGLLVAMISKTEYIPLCILLSLWLLWFERDKEFFKTAVKTIGVYFAVFIAVVAFAALRSPSLPKLPSSFDLATTPLAHSLPDMIGMMISAVFDPHALKIFLPALPVLFLPFLAPLDFLLPAFAQILAGMATWRWMVAMPFWRDLIHSSPPPAAFFFDGPKPMYVLMPMMYFAAARGLSRLLKRNPGRRAQAFLAAAILISTVFSYRFFISPAFGPWPGTAYWDAAYYKHDPRTDRLRSELARLEGGAGKAVVSLPLEMYLPHKVTANPPYADIEAYSEALIDLYLCPAFPRREEVLDWVRKALRGPWTVTSFHDGIIVMRAGAPAPENEEALRFIDRHEDVLLKNYFDFREYRRRILIAGES